MAGLCVKLKILIISHQEQWFEQNFGSFLFAVYKMIYNADELSLYAERCRLYRERKQAERNDGDEGKCEWTKEIKGFWSKLSVLDILAVWSD